MNQTTEHIPQESADQTPSDLDRRLCVLEERTKPKPKSIIDHITDWGGVATFMLALLYTFPLGVWDRFFVSPIDEERKLIIKLTDVDVEYFKTSQNLPIDQQLALTLAARAKKTALLSADRAVVLKRQGAPLAAETELLGYQAYSIGDLQLATQLYDSSSNKAKADNNLLLQADIQRLQAELFVVAGAAGNLNKARQNYADSVKAFLSLNAQYQAALEVWEWANVESSLGSKACAYFLAQRAIQIIAPLDQNRTQQWTMAFQVQNEIDSRANSRPTAPCEKNVVPFVDAPMSAPPMTGPAVLPSTSVAGPEEAPRH
jgi:hypothetical protein